MNCTHEWVPNDRGSWCRMCGSWRGVIEMPDNSFPQFTAGQVYKPDYYRPRFTIPADPDVGDIINAYDLDYWPGQAMAYIVRYKRKEDPKGHLRDLHKAMECLQREIDKEEDRDG